MSGATSDQGEALCVVVRRLARAVDKLAFAPPVSHVYNPLVYARRAHEQYLRSYGGGRKEVLLLGMNPGPFGMAQTGVPFGEVAAARDWLRIEEPVDSPANEHPRRPIEGFDCARSEVSGRRLWGWAERRFGTPQRFFRRFFVHNYCPLVFMQESGRNFTPDKLPAAERAALFAHCDRALLDVVSLLRPRIVVGIGAFAEKRACAVLAAEGVPTGRVLHPSPASPLANRGWEAAVERDFAALGISIGRARQRGGASSATRISK